MARIYQARQREGDGRWDYTVSSDEERWCHPIGYCAGWREATPESEAMVPGLAADVERRRPFQAKYHTSGHATPEEARACYDQYELDHELRVYTQTDAQLRCVECNEWTQRVVAVGAFHREWPVCDAHDARAVATALIGKGHAA